MSNKNGEHEILLAKILHQLRLVVYKKLFTTGFSTIPGGACRISEASTVTPRSWIFPEILGAKDSMLCLATLAS